MRYPPALIFTPRRSKVYFLSALAIAITLIALCAYLLRAIGVFDLKNGFFVALACGAAIWMLRDAWRRPRGQLQYAQGQWTWALVGAQIPGTLRLHLDLQTYMLVSFVPNQTSASFYLTTTQWFHLEERHLDSVVGAPSWLALRRAIVSPAQWRHEERLA